jgi:hypothetical protein
LAEVVQSLGANFLKAILRFKRQVASFNCRQILEPNAPKKRVPFVPLARRFDHDLQLLERDAIRAKRQKQSYECTD